MCGIFDVLQSDDPLDRPLIHATNMLAHRGPTRERGGAKGLLLGSVGLPSSTCERGPTMATADRRFVIVFDGDIYNYVELRDNSDRRHHLSDDVGHEVILDAYQTWEPVAEKLVRMFAFAIVDRVEQTL